MKISIEWLKDFVQINESLDDLVNLLTDLGLEAEISSIPQELPGVVIGRIDSVKKHSNADKLSVCMVNDGRDKHQIVCGAPNVEEGQVIALATVGSVLPHNFKIKKATIRGVESSGMICSERELQISDEHEGIMVLPENLNLGDNFIKAYGSKLHSIILDITPNRPDAFSHIGVARDIACKTKRKLNSIKVNKSHLKANFDMKITSENEKDCPRYVVGKIVDVKVGRSPDWLVNRLKASGQRSINNIVDISNFVLMELGHPTHIFDYDKIKGHSIVVRRAKDGECLVTLDGVERKFDKDNLLITDGEEPIALAGIMGGNNSAVTVDTKTLLIESAYFDPVTLRKSAKKLSMSTDASKRYERGADPNNCDTAFWRVVNLIEDITGGKLDANPIDYYPAKINSRKVELRKSELDLILGISIDKKEVESIFKGLEIECNYANDRWTCIVPTFRPDIEHEIDLIEEIARIHGYQNIPSDTNIYGSFRYEHPDPEAVYEPIRETLISCGFNHIYANSLQSEKEAKLSGKITVSMINPLNIEMGSLRTSLIPGILKAADYNYKRGSKDIRLFELGNVHSKEEGSSKIAEEKFLSGLIMGSKTNNSIYDNGRKEDIFTLKGYLATLFERKLGMKFELKKGDFPGFDLSRNIYLNGRKSGALGRFSPIYMSMIDIQLKEVFGFEINLSSISNMIRVKRIYKPISPFPKIQRDLNLVMPSDQEVGKLIDLFYKKGRRVIIDAVPSNIFIDPEQLGKDKKSVTYTITFQHSSKTLEDKFVNEVINEIIHSAEEKFFAKLRT